METTKLNRVQRTRLKAMCIALGYDTVALGIDKPMTDSNTPANWLELCVRLFEQIVGYNAVKMGNMMYSFLLDTENPVDFLFEEFSKGSIVLESNLHKVQQKKK